MAKPLNHIKVITKDTASVTNASGVVLAANDRRLYAEIVNQSANNIWLAFGEAAVVGEGIYLAPNGFSFVINTDFLWRGNVTAISDVAGPSVLTVLDGQ